MKLKPNKTRSLILKAIKADPNATYRELQAACGASSTSVVEHHVLRLMAAGLIAKGTRWIIK
jgi:hypothetical protein